MTMMHKIALDRATLDLIAAERLKALSAREWMFRLKGHGLEIREFGDKKVVARLPQGNVLGVLPAQLA